MSSSQDNKERGTGSDASGVFARIQAARGSVATIHTAFRDFPVGVAAHFDLYSSIILADDLPLSREAREVLAVATSRANACGYCVAHHEAALAQERARRVADAPSAAFAAAENGDGEGAETQRETQGEKEGELDGARRDVLDAFATALTAAPGTATDFEPQFREAGFSPAQFQHAVMVVAYFNFANRCVFARDLKLEDNYEASCGK